MKTAIVLICAIMLAGCGGTFRSANVVDSYQRGDEAKTCNELFSSIKSVAQQIHDAEQRRKTKIAANTGLIVVGAILFPPLLLGIDTSDVDLTEIKSRQRRYNVLAEIARSKNCEFVIVPIKDSPDRKNLASKKER